VEEGVALLVLVTLTDNDGVELVLGSGSTREDTDGHLYLGSRNTEGTGGNPDLDIEGVLDGVALKDREVVIELVPVLEGVIEAVSLGVAEILAVLLGEGESLPLSEGVTEFEAVTESVEELVFVGEPEEVIEGVGDGVSIELVDEGELESDSVAELDDVLVADDVRLGEPLAELDTDEVPLGELVPDEVAL
jgi:hypothetical protein